jgi:hypothetical protein
VAPSNSDRPFYNPLDGDWWPYLNDDQKREIRSKYPDAAVPGAR